LGRIRGIENQRQRRCTPTKGVTLDPTNRGTSLQEGSPGGEKITKITGEGNTNAAEENGPTKRLGCVQAYMHFKRDARQGVNHIGVLKVILGGMKLAHPCGGLENGGGSELGKGSSRKTESSKKSRRKSKGEMC